ncbi:hypothetical protein [Methylomonas sp. MgM2]
MMPIKFPFDSTKPVAGQASIVIDKHLSEVFAVVGENFFENYPKWAIEVVDFLPLDGNKVFVGARAKQIRKDSDAEIESTFAITDYQPYNKLVLQGLDEPYRHIYQLDGSEELLPTHLTFRFELLELEVFMRPFEKLIRYAIEEGAENMVENIKKIITEE